MKKLFQKPLHNFFAVCFILSVSTSFLSGCISKNLVQESSVATSANSTGDVREYSFETESSKVFLTTNSGERNDITSFVTDIVQGDLYLNADGLRYIFSLGERSIKTEEQLCFEQITRENGYTVTNGKYLCLSSHDHTLIFQEGSKLYLFDGNVRMLDAPCISLENDVFSIPVADLIFAFGYDSFGATLDGESIIYTLIKN